MFRSLCAHHHEVKIVLYSIWYHHTCWWPSGAQVERVLSQPVHRTATYSVWRYQMLYNTILTNDDEHRVLETCRGMKWTYCKTKFCKSSWLITKIKIYMFRTIPLSIIRSSSVYTQQWYMSYRFVDSLLAESGSCSQAVNKPVWHIPLLFVQWKTPDYGQRNCPKHVEFYSKNKFEELVYIVGFIIRIYHDARSPER